MHVAPVVDEREAQALYWSNMNALAATVQNIVYEAYPDPDVEFHEVVRRQRMEFAERLRGIVHRWIRLFAATHVAPVDNGPVPREATLDEKRQAMRAALEASTGVDTRFTAEPAPQSEDLRNRALDLAASAAMFSFGVAPDSDLARQMTHLITLFLSGPKGVPPWQTALQSTIELAALWLRDDPQPTTREVAKQFCARVAAVPGAPPEFTNPTEDQLDSLEAVLDARILRPDRRELRLPRAVKQHAGGRGAASTASSWQLAREFADVLTQKKMPSADDVRRRGKPRKKKNTGPKKK